MPLSFQDISDQIHEKAHAVVPFAISKAEFQQAMDAYVAFLALPQEVKDPIYFTIDPDQNRGDIGYRKYRRELGNTDNREFCHYHTLAEERFREARGRIPELDRLLIAMKHIHDEAGRTLHDVLAAFEEKFPGIQDAFFPKDKPPKFFLRFLKYDCGKPGDFLAKGHYDRGTCTLALAESAPGLRMGIDDLHLQDVVHDEGRALFMPGLNFPEVASNEFPPTWHDVVQKGEDTYNQDIARWAIVFFSDAQGLRKTKYEERHTPKRIET